MIIDELSLGLAPVVVQRLMPTIRAIAESGIGVLLIEQFATVALGLADRAYVMEGGRIRYSGRAQELRDNPDLLHSAYLLRRQRRTQRDAVPAAENGDRRDGRHRAGARARAQRRHRARRATSTAGSSGLRVGERPPLDVPGLLAVRGAHSVPARRRPRRPTDRHAAVARAARSVEAHRSAGPVDHIAFSATDYELVKAQLERTGIAAVRNAVPNGGPRQLFFEDPNGVRIEINVSRAGALGH